MKKLKIVALLAAAALLFSCSQPTSGSSDTNENQTNPTNKTDPNNPNPTTDPGNTDPTFTPPTQPASVGTNSFDGNTYGNKKDYSHQYEFLEGNIVQVWSAHSSITTSNNGESSTTYDDFKLDKVFKYTYNANTKKMYLSLYKMDSYFGLLTYNELVSKYNSLKASDFGYTDETQFSQEKEFFLKMIKKEFETLSVWKIEEITENGSKAISIQAPYYENTSNLDTEFYPTNHSSVIPCIRIEQNSPDSNFGYIYTDQNSDKGNEIRYQITEITNNTITAVKGEKNKSTDKFEKANPAVTIKLSYTVTLITTGNDEGRIKLTVSPADETTKNELSFATISSAFELISENEKEIYKIEETESSTTPKESTNTPVEQDNPKDPINTPVEQDDPDKTSTTDTELDSTFTPPELPKSVGNDPFAGKVFATDDAHYVVFGNDNTFTLYGTSEVKPKDSYPYIKNTIEKIAYTYDATTQIMSRRLIASNNIYRDSNDLIDYQAYYELFNAIPYEQYAADNPDATREDFLVERKKTFELYRNRYFGTIDQIKCRLDNENNLKNSKYYPKGTTITSSLIRFAYDFKDLGTASNGDGTCEIGIDNSYSNFKGYLAVPINSINFVGGLEIVNITDNTIITETWSDETQANEYHFTYTETWADGVITLTISGADDVTKTAIGNHTYTLTSFIEASIPLKAN